MNVQDLRVIRRMSALMPIKDPIKREMVQINKLDFSKHITFITPRSISREIAFYYLYHNGIIDFVKLFTAEEIKDIYFGTHPDYKSLLEIMCPTVVVLLGKEMYNKQMVSILNIFVDHFLSLPSTKSLLFIYEGSLQEFKNLYKNAQERGILSTGKTVHLTNTAQKAVPEL